MTLTTHHQQTKIKMLRWQVPWRSEYFLRLALKESLENNTQKMNLFQQEYFQELHIHCHQIPK
jgi:hypothetical protein